MSLDSLINEIQDFGRDTRLNIEGVLTPEGVPGLSPAQLWSTALACSYALLNEKLSKALIEKAGTELPSEYKDAAKSAASIMAMNNVYYRFLHLADDKEFSKIPARLRMNVIGRPGIAKVDFELMCLAVSALSGCGACINAHIQETRKGGISNEGIQSSIRIASVLNAVKTSLHLSVF